MSRQQTLAGQVWGGLPRTGGSQVRPAAAWQRTAQPGGGQGVQQFQGGGQSPGVLGAMMGAFGNELANSPSVQPLDYGAGAWNILDPFGGQQPQQPAQPTQITTGIGQPDFAAPEFGPPPAPMEGISDVAAQSAQSGLAQQLQPQQLALQEQYQTGSAGLQDAFMRSRAQAGLGWGGQAIGMQNLQNQNQGNLLRFLSGMA